MKKKTVIGLLLITGLVLLAAWSPWITARSAGSIVETQFNAAWAFIIDGCGTNCLGCGTDGFEKAPFGGYITLHFRCGLYMPAEPMPSERVFVSFLGTVHGLPAP